MSKTKKLLQYIAKQFHVQKNAEAYFDYCT